MSIVIVLAQYNLQFDSNYNYNYCYISRSQGSSFSANDGAYYFIKSMKWKSTEAIELELEMDVLNTFGYDSDYNVTDKTLVKRQHKNRFELAEQTYTKTYIPDCEYTTTTKTVVAASGLTGGRLIYLTSFPPSPGNNLAIGSPAITAEQAEIFNNYDVQYEIAVHIQTKEVRFEGTVTLGGISAGVVPYAQG